MSGLRRWAVYAALTLAFSSSSCQLFKKAPPPTPPSPAQQQPPDLGLPDKSHQPPPEIPAPELSTSQTAQPNLNNVPSPIPEAKPSVPKPPKQPSRRPTQSAQPGPATPENPPGSPGEESGVPQLRPILTAEQQQQLNESITRQLNRAQAALGVIERRRLNRQQASSAQQIRTFIRQAQDARRHDLIRANNLAERADVLSQDLLNSLR